MMCVAVLGLGDAGRAIAADLLAAGAVVHGYDPDPTAVADAPGGVIMCEDVAEAARGADAVLSVNSSAAALDALRGGLAGTGEDAAWADLNTAAPQKMRELAEVARTAGVAFADVSLMAPVPGKGLRTPMLASGGRGVRAGSGAGQRAARRAARGDGRSHRAADRSRDSAADCCRQPGLAGGSGPSRRGLGWKHSCRTDVFLGIPRG